MEDNEIINLFWRRSEVAISETDKKYGKYCRYISNNVLRSDTEAEECVDDTYMQLWRTIPPQRPVKFSAYIGSIVRNISINRFIKNRALKRYNGAELVLDEISEIIPDPYANESSIVNAISITDSLNKFLGGLSSQNRIVFIRRYYHMASIGDIAKDMSMSASAVKILLFRIRKKLKQHLIKEEIEI